MPVTRVVLSRDYLMIEALVMAVTLRESRSSSAERAPPSFKWLTLRRLVEYGQAETGSIVRGIDVRGICDVSSAHVLTLRNLDRRGSHCRCR